MVWSFKFSIFQKIITVIFSKILQKKLMKFEDKDVIETTDNNPMITDSLESIKSQTTHAEPYNDIKKCYYPTGGLVHERFYNFDKLLKMITYYPGTHINGRFVQNIKQTETLFQNHQEAHLIKIYNASGFKIQETYFTSSGEVSMEIHYDLNGSKKYQGLTKEGKYDGQGISFENGFTKYTGQFQNGLQHGIGKLYYKNSQIQQYEGQFDKNKKHGSGVYYQYKEQLTVPKYKGYFVNDHFEGQGKLYDDNGQLIYQGNFKEGIQNGEGTSFVDQHKEYEGWWENGIYQNEGKLFYAGNGNIRYEGYWQNGVLIKGVHCNDNGRVVYDGYWTEGFIKSGYGVFYSSCTGMKMFEGYGHDSSASGFGIRYYHFGNKFCKGLWESNSLIFYEASEAEKAKGWRTFVREDGTIYVGESLECKIPNGFGKTMKKDCGGLLYEGQWKNGIQNGYGVCYNNMYDDYHVSLDYIGEWKDGVKEGMGRFYGGKGKVCYEGLMIESEENEITGIENNAEDLGRQNKWLFVKPYIIKKNHDGSIFVVCG